MAQKTYVITGAKSGIGLEMTRQLVARKQKVFVGIRKAGAAPADELNEMSLHSEGLLTVIDLDVQSEGSIAKFLALLSAPHIDVLINNAGVYSKDDGVAGAVTPEQVQWTLNTNFFGPLRLTQALLPLLSKASHPVIANISSKMGSIGENSSGGSLAYRVSKAAVNMFTKNLALDEPEVISLTLHPGWVKTRMGGDAAPLSVYDSAKGLLQTIEAATKKQSGSFMNYDGAPLAW